MKKIKTNIITQIILMVSLIVSAYATNVSGKEGFSRLFILWAAITLVIIACNIVKYKKLKSN